MSWKVLLRRPFFTIISLIGISFTLMILMVGVAFYENSYAPNGVMKNFDRVVSISHLKLSNTEKQNTNEGTLGYYFIKEYVKKMKIPEEISFTSNVRTINIFRNDLKFELNVRYIDAQFWNIARFEFLKGRSFNDMEVKNADPTAVIDYKTCMEYFGTSDAIGKQINIKGIEYKISGIVKNESSIRTQVYANVFLPYTTGKLNLTSSDYLGPFECLLMAKKASDIEKIRTEWAQTIPRIAIPKDMTKVESYITTQFDQIIENYTLSQTSHFSFIAIFVLLLLLFMLLPSLNLANLNITRIMERSAEIGIRKSFGASSKKLIVQFIIENVFLTFIGGFLGLALSVIVLQFIEFSGVFPNTNFSINAIVFIYCLLLSLIFGLMSGVYPAWKMSKLNIMNALREGKI